nr:hypothetical protein [Spirochaetota bacterium]
MKKILFLFFIISNCFLFSKNFEINVTDKDLDIPLEGVRIIIANLDKTVFSDFDGTALVYLDDSVSKISVVASLIGYETKKAIITDFTKPFSLKMLIQGVLEGKELVIEEKSIGKKDEKVGVSTVIDKQIMDST